MELRFAQRYKHLKSLLPRWSLGEVLHIFGRTSIAIRSLKSGNIISRSLVHVKKKELLPQFPNLYSDVPTTLKGMSQDLAEERAVEKHYPELGKERNEALRNAEEMERSNLEIRAGRLKSAGARPKDARKVAVDPNPEEQVAEKRASRRLQRKEVEFKGI